LKKSIANMGTITALVVFAPAGLGAYSVNRQETDSTASNTKTFFPEIPWLDANGVPISGEGNLSVFSKH
jgi:hypothetical protein